MSVSDEELEAMKPTLEAVMPNKMGLGDPNYWFPDDTVDDCNCNRQEHCPNVFRCRNNDQYWKTVVRERLKI